MAGDRADHGGDHDLARVRVTGTGSIRTEPDEALIWITLTALDESPGAALEDVARRGDALAALLDGLGVERTDRSTSGITVQEEFDHTKEGRRPLGHRAVATLALRMRDSERIGQVMMRATTELDARIRGPSWRVSPDNPIWLEVARLASINAERRAAAYAAGVNARLGRLVALIEDGDDRSPRIARAAARTAAVGSDLPIDAGEHEVTAAVQAEFELERDG